MSTVRDEITAELTQVNTKEALAEWLWNMLLLTYSKKEGLMSLIRAQNLESPMDSLVIIYEECIPSTKQLIFRQAIGDILSNKGNDENAPLDPLEDLIYLIARIKATEPLKALLPTVGNGLLGKRYPDILYVTFACLLSFRPSSEVYKVTLDLTSSENFDDGYLFTAIKIIKDCDPSGAPGIINDFMPRLINLRNLSRKIGGQEWDAFCNAAKDAGMDL